MDVQGLPVSEVEVLMIKIRFPKGLVTKRGTLIATRDEIPVRKLTIWQKDASRKAKGSNSHFGKELIAGSIPVKVNVQYHLAVELVNFSCFMKYPKFKEK